jgi:hypothetical protein
MATQKIINAEADKDLPLNYTKDDLYDRSNDTSILLIMQRRLRKQEKQFDRLIAFLEARFGVTLNVKNVDD